MATSFPCRLAPALSLSLALTSTSVAAMAGEASNRVGSRPSGEAHDPVWGVQRIESRYDVDDTVSRLQRAIQAKGMTLFAVIDHQAAARASGLSMQPAKVVIFGAPKLGTPLMRKDPEFALRLPLRVLVTEIDGKTRVVFNETRALIAGSRIEYGEVENTLAKAEALIRAAVTAAD